MGKNYTCYSPARRINLANVPYDKRGKNDYKTVGKNGDYANVTILSGGKLKVAFTNVMFTDESDNKVKVSRTIIEE